MKLRSEQLNIASHRKMVGKSRGTIYCRVPKADKSCWVLGPGKKKGSYNQSIESKGENPRERSELESLVTQEYRKRHLLSTGVKVSHGSVLHRKVTWFGL